MMWAQRRPLAAGLMIGLAWGVAMRAWMRFISPDPEFTWSGTLFILGAGAIVGALLGLARRRRRDGGLGWWRMSALSLGLLGAGGAVMWPSVVLGGIGFGRPGPRWMRVGLLVAAAGAQVPVMQSVIAGNWRMSTAGAVVATIWYAPMLALEAWGFSVVFAPAAAGTPIPGRLKRAVMAVPLAVVVTGGLLTIGLPGG